MNDTWKAFAWIWRERCCHNVNDWEILSVLYNNNCPMTCNTKQSIYYSASSLYMFWVSTTPIIRSRQNCNCSHQYWPYLAALEWGSCSQKITPVSESSVTVLCTPDNGCGWHPKHVEWTCRIVNRLLCLASLWTIVNIDQRCMET